jgi:hypothetical protein
VSKVELNVQPIVDGIKAHVKEIAGQRLIFLDDTRVLRGTGKHEGKFKLLMYTTADFELAIEIDCVEAFRNENYFASLIPDINGAIETYLGEYQKCQSMDY